MISFVDFTRVIETSFYMRRVLKYLLLTKFDRPDETLSC